MYGKHLDKETRQDCRETEKLLRAALAGRVAQTPKPKGELQDSELFDAEGSQSVAPPRSSTQTGRTGADRRTSSSRDLLRSSLEAEKEMTPCWTITQISREGPLHEEDSEDLLTPLKPVKKKARFALQKSFSNLDVIPARNEAPDSPIPSSHPRLSEGGKEAYQKAIQSLGSAKSRLLSQSLAQPDLTDEGSTKAALVPSEEYLGDDWLEDDLRSEFRSRKRLHRSPTPVEIEELEESSECEEEDGPEERWRDKVAPRTLTLSRKRSRQTKLTQIVDRAIVG
ncbi:unnamed protein product, partial [Staurois parvus]